MTSVRTQWPLRPSLQPPHICEDVTVLTAAPRSPAPETVPTWVPCVPSTQPLGPAGHCLPDLSVLPADMGRNAPQCPRRWAALPASVSLRAACCQCGGDGVGGRSQGVGLEDREPIAPDPLL